MPAVVYRLGGSQIILIFISALVLRAGFGGWQLARSPSPGTLTFPDEQQYWQMSRGLRQGDLLTDELGFHATRMPVYPAFLALFGDSTAGVVGAKVCHWFVSALTAVLAGLLASRVVGRGGGLVAGLVVAADPGLVGMSSLLLTETPSLAVLTALWWVGWPLQRRGQAGEMDRWLGVGLLAVVAVYIRPSNAGLVALLTFFLIVRRRGDLRSWLGAGIVGAVVVVSLLPWAARNQRVTGHWCWLTHRLGISLYDGVGPQATGAGDLGQIKLMSAVAGLDETDWNRYFLDASLRSMRDDPVRIFRLAVVKLARTWSPILHADEYRSKSIRVIFAAWSIIFYGLAVVGLVILRKEVGTCLALLLPALYISGLHSLFVGSVRYRLGATPMLAVLVAVAVVFLWTRWGISTKKTA